MTGRNAESAGSIEQALPWDRQRIAAHRMIEWPQSSVQVRHCAARQRSRRSGLGVRQLGASHEAIESHGMHSLHRADSD